MFVRVLAQCALRPAAAAPAVAEPRLQRHQIHPVRPRAGRLPPPRRAAAHRRLRHRHRHSAGQAARGVLRVSSPRARAPRWPAALGSASRSSSGSPAFSITRSTSPRRSAAARISPIEVPIAPAALRARARRRSARRPRTDRRDPVLCVDNDRQYSRRHDDAAARLGLRGAGGRRSAGRRCGRARGRQAAGRPPGRLPSRSRQRHRGRAALRQLVRSGHAGGADYCRSFTRGARGRARAGIPCSTSRSSRRRCAP